MHWHFVEQLACVLWARPERTFCTCGRPSRRVARPPPRARSGLPPLAASTPALSLAAEPPLEPHSAAVRSATAASGRPQQALPRTAPPKPPARASCPLEQPELIHKLVGTRSSPPRRPAATERRSPAFLSTAAVGTDLDPYKWESPSPFLHSGNLLAPQRCPHGQQAMVGSFLPRLRSVRSPPQSSAVRRNQGLPHPSNATVRLPSTVRSLPASKLRSGATTAQIPNHARSLRCREARRRRSPPSPGPFRLPEGSSWSGGSFPTLGWLLGAVVHRRRSPEPLPRLGQRRKKAGD